MQANELTQASIERVTFFGKQIDLFTGDSEARTFSSIAHLMFWFRQKYFKKSSKWSAAMPQSSIMELIRWKLATPAKLNRVNLQWDLRLREVTCSLVQFGAVTCSISIGFNWIYFEFFFCFYLLFFVVCRFIPNCIMKAKSELIGTKASIQWKPNWRMPRSIWTLLHFMFSARLSPAVSSTGTCR